MRKFHQKTVALDKSENSALRTNTPARFLLARMGGILEAGKRIAKPLFLLFTELPLLGRLLFVSMAAVLAATINPHYFLLGEASPYQEATKH